MTFDEYQALAQRTSPADRPAIDKLTNGALGLGGEAGEAGPQLRHVVGQRHGEVREAVERDHIISVLEQTQWKVSGKNSAAQILDLNRSTLRARMRKLNIVKP